MRIWLLVRWVALSVSGLDEVLSVQHPFLFGIYTCFTDWILLITRKNSGTFKVFHSKVSCSDFTKCWFDTRWISNCYSLCLEYKLCTYAYKIKIFQNLFIYKTKRVLLHNLVFLQECAFCPSGGAVCSIGRWHRLFRPIRCPLGPQARTRSRTCSLWE